MEKIEKAFQQNNLLDCSWLEGVTELLLVWVIPLKLL